MKHGRGFFEVQGGGKRRFGCSVRLFAHNLQVSRVATSRRGWRVGDERLGCQSGANFGQKALVYWGFWP